MNDNEILSNLNCFRNIILCKGRQEKGVETQEGTACQERTWEEEKEACNCDWGGGWWYAQGAQVQGPSYSSSQGHLWPREVLLQQCLVRHNWCWMLVLFIQHWISVFIPVCLLWSPVQTKEELPLKKWRCCLWSNGQEANGRGRYIIFLNWLAQNDVSWNCEGLHKAWFTWKQAIITGSAACSWSRRESTNSGRRWRKMAQCAENRCLQGWNWSGYPCQVVLTSIWY